MSFEISPVTEADLESWVRVHFKAFSPALPMLYDREPSAESFTRLAQMRTASLSNPRVSSFKAVDQQTGKAVAFATWSVYERERSPAELDEDLRDREPIPEEKDGVRQSFMAGIMKARRDVIGGRPHVLLGTLTVLPEYQGKGIGTMLIQWGVDEADRLALPAYLESSKAGKRLYEKVGYKAVQEIKWDTRPFGGDSVDIHTVMIREPKSTS